MIEEDKAENEHSDEEEKLEVIDQYQEENIKQEAGEEEVKNQDEPGVDGA